MPFLVVITGIQDIDRKLKTLEPRLQKKVLRQSMRAGMKIIQSEMMAQAPVDTGLMRSKVEVRALKSKGRHKIAIEARIGADEKFVVITKSGKRYFYPAAVEYGTRDLIANPFGRRAYEAKADVARAKTVFDIKVGVEREVSKGG